MKLARILLVAGILFGLPSLWETLSFSWDPSFQAPALRFGPTHTNYHVFREFALTLGALATMVWVLFQPAANRSRPLWTQCSSRQVAITSDGGYPGPFLVCTRQT